MYKYIFITVISILLFSGCSSNVLVFDELGDSVANKESVVNNYEGTILNLETYEDTETMSVVLPKDNMTLRVKIRVANIEDVLYMNLVESSGGFDINKLLRRVSSLDELSLTQDGWLFEPSVDKGVITLQLYLPSIYLYQNLYAPKLIFSYKRSARSLQESIQFNFIKQNYFVSSNDDGFEVPKYGDLEEYCRETEKSVDGNFTLQIERLNTNRVDEDMITNLRGLCK